jgi:hypothetical protein
MMMLQAFSTFIESLKNKLSDIKKNVDGIISGRRRSLLMERLGPDMLTAEFEVC